MKFIKASFLLCCVLCFKLQDADAAATHAVKGLVITPNGTAVPDFTVVVKHLTDKPQLARRLHFKNGKFEVDELPAGKYQLQITAPLFIGARLISDFTTKSNKADYRIVILHLYRNEPRLMPVTAQTVSVKVLQRKQQKIPQAAVEAYKTAVALHRDGKLEEAMIAYGTALRNCPRYVEALTDIGSVFLLYNRPESALTFLRRAQEIDDSNVIVNFNIAVALTEQGDYGAAVKLVNSVLRTEPRFAWAQYFKARIEYIQKKYDQAEIHAREAIDNDPGLLDAMVLMINISIEQRKYDQAREALERVREALHDQMVTTFIDEQLLDINEQLSESGS